jgi:N-acetylmuramoyl-L-alanine amidase
MFVIRVTIGGEELMIRVGLLRQFIKYVTAGFFLLGLACTEAVAAPEVVNVRLGENHETTRFVLEVREKISFTVSQLADPYRVIVDITEVDWKNNSSGEGAGRGLVQKYRFGAFRPGISRIVLDLKKPVKVTQSFIIPPRGEAAYRLVVDLKEAGRDEFVKNIKAPGTPEGAPAAAALTAPSSDTAAADDTPRQAPVISSGKKIIVIDPGHGGVDPGSPSVVGVPEKFITLAAARAARDELNATGRYRAILTRDDDTFIPLRQRFEIARRQKADLFISFHADSHADKRVRGATVYTLSEKSSDREAAALAAKENKSDLIAGIDLGGESKEVSTILIDLAQRETMNFSANFANLLVSELKEDILLGRNSHRFAGFMVLKAPDIPSVLVEMGYLSNRQDATLLASPAHQKKMGDAVIRAIDDYFTKVAVR